MSKIQWEYDLVEKPFCEQLKAMGWQWLEGDTDVPELTERETFREVLHHGPELWRILDRSLPDWRMRCEELKIKVRDIYWCHDRMVQ